MRSVSDMFSCENRAAVCTFLLGLCGLLTIASSQSAADRPLHLVLRQLAFLAVGLALMAATARIRFDFWKKHTPELFFLFWLLLLLLPFFGSRINGMRGWFRIGPLSFQPSECGRPFFLLALVSVFCGVPAGMKRLAASGLLTALWLTPICLQPDFGTVMIYALAFLVIYFLSGAPWKHLLLLATGACVSAASIVVAHPYVLKRFSGFLFPERDPMGSGWHVRQFELAAARGHWFGSKLGSAVWSNAYLPFSYNDSAGATLIETLGLAGAAVPALLFIVLLLALHRLAGRPGLSGTARLFIAGTAVFLGLQVLVHMGVNLALLPPSGLVLPFISYGGSSLAGCCAMLGIALSASGENDGKTGSSTLAT
ncbi:MAG: FtsW/RodA/SpoVE family cell cycle protein [Lentisphaeria bacterium]|nr:FtsW/RodA/SpoVE family cell cycle protein [Lentisphaeria bacterium]